MTRQKRGKKGAQKRRTAPGGKLSKMRKAAVKVDTASSNANPEVVATDTPSTPPPSPLPYVTELTPDEHQFLAALAGRADLREEIAFLRLSLFRAERSHADSKELASLARALQQLVNSQNRLGSDTAREFETLLGKAMDAVGEKWGREL